MHGNVAQRSIGSRGHLVHPRQERYPSNGLLPAVKTRVAEVDIVRTRSFERASYLIGASLLLVWLAVTASGRLLAQQAVESFEAEPVDQTGWSATRIAAYAATRGGDLTPPVAVLRIPRLKIAVPVLEGIDDELLDRGVGHIPETASPGEAGNIAIAGHRDGFFRSLKDVRAGDTIQLSTRKGEESYVVEQTWIVQPEDVSVLEPTTAPSMTLVTCYPFYYVGSAPQRFIVRATRTVGDVTRASDPATPNR